MTEVERWKKKDESRRITRGPSEVVTLIPGRVVVTVCSYYHCILPDLVKSLPGDQFDALADKIKEKGSHFGR